MGFQYRVILRKVNQGVFGKLIGFTLDNLFKCNNLPTQVKLTVTNSHCLRASVSYENSLKSEANLTLPFPYFRQQQTTEHVWLHHSFNRWHVPTNKKHAKHPCLDITFLRHEPKTSDFTLKVKFKIHIIFLSKATAPFELTRYAGRNQRNCAETWFTVDSNWSIFTARKRSLGQGNIFIPVCHSVRGGACVVALGGMHGCSGGMCGCTGGACVVLFGGCMRGFFIQGACMVLFGGCVWFYSGGMHDFIQGGGHAWFYSRGACMVLFGGHAWFYLGGHAWFFQFFQIQWDTVNERAVRILLECILVTILWPSSFHKTTYSIPYLLHCHKTTWHFFKFFSCVLTRKVPVLQTLHVDGPSITKYSDIWFLCNKSVWPLPKWHFIWKSFVFITAN